MSKIADKNIAVLKGGPGSEREVSLVSAAGVSRALSELGAMVVEIDIKGPGFTIPPDVFVAFNLIHGTFGEDGQLQKILEDMNIPYTGEGVEGSRLAFDKIESKRKFIEHRIPTAAFEVIKSGAKPSMPLPYVVKAPKEGSSVGVYIVMTEAEVEPALREAARYADALLVEKFVKGRELTVGILGELALPIIEICPKEGFYNFKNKYPFLNPNGNSGANHFCPAPLDSAETRLVQTTALDAHRSLGLEVYSRVDVLLSEEDGASVLEINTIPGMTEASLLPEAAGVAGIGYGELCERIIELSMRRRQRK
jgi:D-alanine-D-alanine ligase